MKEKELIPIDNEFKEEEPSILVVPRKGRRKRRKSKGCGCFLLILATLFVLLTVKLFPYIQDFITSLIPEQSHTHTSGDITASSNNDVNDGIDRIEEKYEIKDTYPEIFSIKNDSDTKINFDTIRYELPKANEIYEKYGNDAPVVLISHFSPCEGYSGGDFYSPKDSFYNDEKNVYAIGEKICEILCSAGINSLHTEIRTFDKSLINSKSDYEREINNLLKENPSIAYVIDISRSVQINDDLTMSKPYVKNGDVMYPTIQLFVGTGDTVISDAQRKNIYFACELARYINSNVNNLVNQAVISRYSLSQGFDAVCLRADIGSYAHTYEEALFSANKFALLLIEFLKY